MSPRNKHVPDQPAPRGLSEHQDCGPLAKILQRIGDKWTLLIIVLLGEKGPMRFNEMRRLIGGISQRMLTLTLRALERDGLVNRTVFPTVPPKVEYALTPLGQTLLPPIESLVTWGRANLGAIAEAQAAFDRRAAEEAAEAAQLKGQITMRAGTATSTTKMESGRPSRQ